ncbi:MAG: tandem-95 repeat protein, partial [Tenuifilaceae bacterium]|nr:tandem-95 repeat protein [Tenuifilaceae bacterium]
MKRLFTLAVLSVVFLSSFAQEGTKQLMPIKEYPLYLEFNVFAGGNFGNYNANEKERIYIYLKEGETMHFGMKMNTVNYGGNVGTTMANNGVRFRVRRPNGTTIFAERQIPTSGTGFISTYENAIAGPNGVILNGSEISGGYTPYSFTADMDGNYYIEYNVTNNGLRVRIGGIWYTVSRFALEFFDVTVTDDAGNVVTNPGDPNRSAGRLWSYGWQLTNTSFDNYPVNAHFYVFTEDEFVNKVNFEMTPFSFIFLANSFGIRTNSSEANYVKRTQSMEQDQISGDPDIPEYPIFLNDPDRAVWQNTKLPPPQVQVWAEEELFMDYNYNRDPLYLPLSTSSVTLEKNREGCTFDDVTFFKIETSLDGYTVILLDIDEDGEYSVDGSDRVIYRELKRGLNYILWDFKNDNGAPVANKTYNASATFLGRAPSHFPLYDVETLSGITTSAIRPFSKLNTTIYWDDTQITRWGDVNDPPTGLMDNTQQKQLRVENHIPRNWMYRSDWQGTRHNGEENTMNTWFNAIDLGYSSFDVVVQQSAHKCVDGSAPWVGDVYIEKGINEMVTFDRETLEYKYFHPGSVALSAIRIKSIPSEGQLQYNGSSVSVNQEVSVGNIGLLTYTPTSGFHGKTYFEWEAIDATGNTSNNSDYIYLIFNTPPTITDIPDQRICTNVGTGEIPFTVADVETSASELTVTGFSSDPDFVPHGNIVIVGADEDRTVTVTPVPNISGKAIIYLMVDDGLSKVVTEFAVQVSPSLEFTGNPIVCTGNNLILNAVEAGADYEWESPTGTKYDTKGINVASPTMGTWSLTVTKTVEGLTCASTREFEVEVAPITTFTGDLDVCIGEPLVLSATENNATYEWRKDGSVISTDKTYSVASASTANAGDYTLKVTKYTCTNTSAARAVTVIAQPNVGMTVAGSTVDPGKTGTITLGSSQVDVNYSVYKSGSLVTSESGTGSPLSISIPSASLTIGANEFVVTASNTNCEVELSKTSNAVIHVNQPGITVSPTTLNTTESGYPVTFNVSLDTEPINDVVIAIESGNTEQGTVLPASITLTSANYSTGVDVTVTPGRDYVVNDGVTYTITLHPATGTDPHYAGMDPDDVTVTNSNIDVAGLSVVGSPLTTTEVGGHDSFTVALTSKPTHNVIVTFSGVVDTEGIISDESIEFTPDNWDTPQTITVTGVDDDIQDGDYPYTINLSSSSSDANYQGKTTSVSVTNQDNDVAALTITPTTTTSDRLRTYEDPSGDKPTFTIKLETRPSTSVTIDIASSNTSEGTVSPSTVTFTKEGWSVDDVRTITISGVPDDVDDDDVEYQVNVTVRAGSASEYLGKTAVVYALNEDNNTAGIQHTPLTIETSEPDVSQTLRVRLTSKPSATISVAVSSTDTNEGVVSPASLTFTTVNWNTYQDVTVTGVDDDVIDGPQPYKIILNPSGDAKYDALPNVEVNATNLDNDVAGLELTKTTLATSENETSDSFGVRLTAKPSSNVVISITGLDETEGSIDKSSLTFTPDNWSVYQYVTVTGVEDEEMDGNQTYTLTLAYSSGDSDFSTVTAAVTVTNADNDEAGVTVTERTLNITEGAAAGTFTIGLNSQPAEGTTVTYTFASPNVNEITLSANEAVFTHDSWADVAINVTAIDDQIDDGNQTYTIVIGAPTSCTDPNYTAISAGDITVKVTDIHTAGITVSAPSGNTTEDGGTATFTVVLNTKPEGEATITSTSQDETEGIVTGNGTITFDDTDWNTPKTVTVTGQNDDVQDGPQEYTVLVAVSGADSKYDAALNKIVTLINEDNDVAGITITQITDPFQTTEAGGTVEFSIRLNSEPVENVNINLSSSNTSEGLISSIGGSTVTGNNHDVEFTSANWATPITVVVTGQNDFIDDGDVDYQINVAVSSIDTNYGSAHNTSISLKNIDDDTAGVTIIQLTDPFQTTEDLGEAKFSVRLNSQPTHTVTITSLSDNSLEGEVIAGATLTFSTANWSVAQEVTVRGVNDDFVDGNVGYTVTITASSTDPKYNGSNITIPKVNLVNIDNNEVGLILSKASLETSEPDVEDSFTVSLKSKPYDEVTVAVSSSNTDEGVVSPATLTFSPTTWNTPQTVTVTGQDDDIVDGSVGYSIILATSSAGDAAYNFADITIPAVNNDNDEAKIIVSPTPGLVTSEAGGTATFTIVLASMPSHPVSIKLTSDTPTEGVVTHVTRGTVNDAANEAYVTFEPSEWNSPVTITVTGVDDDYDDGIRPYYIVTHPAESEDEHYKDLDAVNVSVVNNDNDTWGVIVTPTSLTVNENGESKSFTIVLNSRPTHNVQIPLESNNASRLTVSPASVTFETASPNDWKTPKLVTVTPVNNLVDEGDETITVITNRIVSDDVNYRDFNPADVSVEFIEDDEAGINVSSISGNTTEGGAQATFTIVLNSQPTADVTIGISSSNVDEGTVLPTSVTFTSSNWDVEQTVTVTGVDDDAIDGNVIYYIEFNNAVSTDLTYNDMAIPNVEVINEDDDSAGVSVFPISGLVTSEAGQTASFTVRLNTIPTDDVLISIVSSDVTEGTVSPASLTFTSGNWDQTQTVTVTGIDDLVDDGDQAYTINLAIESTDDENYQPVTIQSVAVTNIDDITPRPIDDAVTTDQENAVDIDVLGNDLGLDYAPVAVSIHTQPERGTVVVNHDNTITYTPNSYYHGDFSFQYRVTNRLDNHANATVTVTVNRVDVTPIANDDFRGTSVNTPVEVDVLFNDDNLYDIPITVTTVGPASPSGSLEVTTENRVIFTPSADYVGIATFTYRVTDNDGDFDEALVTINVREANHTPIANDDIVTVIKNTPKTINVLANDSGLDDGFGSMAIHSHPANGAVIINDNRTVTYTPNNDFIGDDSFEYFIQDVDGDYDLATVHLTVIDQPNAMPVAVDDYRATEMDTPVTIDVLFNDYGLEDGVSSVTLASEPSNGVAVVNPDFTITYTPNTGFLGTETFRYQVCDTDGDCSNTALVTILVKPTGTNHNPVANDDAASTFVNIPVHIDVLANDSGLEDGLGSISIHTTPEFGNAVVNSNNTITYTPSYMFTGVVTFQYVVTDVDGDFDMATVTVTVQEKLNSTPVANDVSVATGFNTPRVIDVLYNDLGLDDKPITVTIRQQASPEQGNAVANGDNMVTFTPATGYVGVATFEYMVTDADGDSDWATVTVTVKDGENFIPVANDDAATTLVNTMVEIDVLDNDTGLDDGFGSLTIYEAPAFGSAVVTASRTIEYTPSNLFEGEVTFRYLLTDVDGDFDMATVTVTVQEKPNAIPVA